MRLNMQDANDNVDKNVDNIIKKFFIEKRKIFLWGTIDNEIAKKIIETFFYLDAVNSKEDITFYINTPGGSITAGMAIYDTIKMISSPVNVVVMGMAASMGSILLSASKKGRRFLYPNAKVMIHQPLILGQIVAQAVDLNIQAKEIEKWRKILNTILSKASGQPIHKIEKDTDRDFYLTAQESIDYGLADFIVETL